jgi:hypothetical protein
VSAGNALGYSCPLFARKFSKASARWLRDLYRSCTADLRVLTCDPAADERDEQWWRRAMAAKGTDRAAD